MKLLRLKKNSRRLAQLLKLNSCLPVKIQKILKKPPEGILPVGLLHIKLFRVEMIPKHFR